MKNRLVLLLAVHSFSFLSTAEKERLFASCRRGVSLKSLGKGDILRISGSRHRPEIDGETRAETGRTAVDRAERAVRALEQINARVIGLDDPEYPPLLREIYDPPFLLFLRGSLPNQSVPSLAVVGTRRPSSVARQAGYRSGIESAELGLPVVSGLAFGIDVNAHTGCLDAGGMTLAVLGSGIDMLYPKAHRRAAARMLETGGGVLSEYMPGVPPMKYRFPARNRIISGMSRGVLLVQAPENSGALITCDFAVDQGRDVFVHREGSEGIPGLGGRRLLFAGADGIRSVSEIARQWLGNNAAAGRAVPPKSGKDIAHQLELELGYEEGQANEADEKRERYGA
ncbi:MAG: DNA-processing protein DprA [Spirochaetales bacterium]|nr:DNA-processing protein DprA [Spirochaetales bacterium]MCF7937624.1 DNA-processing protein DprA [Spirochaetales bacterium]